MFKDLAIRRSALARSLFLASVITTLAVMALASALPTMQSASGLVPIFRILFAVDDLQGSVCALGILLAAAAVASVYPPALLLRWIGAHPKSLALASLAILSAGAWFVYQNNRLSMDEYSQYFQSQIFAAGHLSGRYPVALLDWLIPRGFQGYFLNVSHTDGTVASVYWPSFALILTPFTWLGIPWLCNPIISAATLLVLHRLAMRLFSSHEAAGLVLLLTVSSPVFFADGISYYSMSAHLLANALFALLLSDTTPRRAFLAGIVGSVALTLHNPVPHMLFAIPWIVSLLRRKSERGLAAMLLAGYLPLCVLLGFGWFIFSSHFSVAGLATMPREAGIAESMTRIASVAALPSASIWLARLIGVAKIWAWSVPGLLLIAIYGGWKSRGNRWCATLSASALLTLLLYVFVPVDQGHGWGYRYFHSAWLVLPVLGAAAFFYRPNNGELPLSVQAALSFTIMCSLITAFVGTGLRAFQMHQLIAQHQSFLPQYTGTGRKVIIIDPRYSFYGLDLVQNDPWLRSDTIRMITHGAEADAQMMSTHFADMHREYTDKRGSVWSTR